MDFHPFNFITPQTSFVAVVLTGFLSKTPICLVIFVKATSKRFLHVRGSQSYFRNFADEPKQIYDFQENLCSNCKLGGFAFEISPRLIKSGITFSLYHSIPGNLLFACIKHFKTKSRECTWHS